MNTGKKLGIWLDHAHAHLIKFTADPMETVAFESKFTHQDKAASLSRSEKGMHDKENHQQAEYFKKLGEVMRGYEEVVLFGPTDAKNELYNTLKDNPLFSEVRIFVVPADKMSAHEEHAFVRDYFSKG